MITENTALHAARDRRAAMLEAAARLEFAISSPIGTGTKWTDDVADALRHLRTALAGHVEDVERPGGLLTDIVAQAPRLANRVKRMHSDHEQMFTTIDGMVEGIPRSDSSEDIREKCLDLLGMISRHRQRGADLVYRAYNVDIGNPG